MRNSPWLWVCLLSLTSLFMYGFCFALVPIYNKYCKTIGINTALTQVEYDASPDLSREIMIEFTAINNQNLPWNFSAQQAKMIVHPGARNKTLFFVKNNSNIRMTVQAIPSFAPSAAANYFHKVECFCFSQQTLKPGEAKWMPVVFKIDKNIPTEMNTISLAYTLFDVTRKEKQT